MLYNEIFIALVFTNYSSTPTSSKIVFRYMAWVRRVEYFCVRLKIQINFVTSKLLPCYYFRISTLISNNKPQHGCYFTLYSLTKIINLIRKKNQVTFLFHSFNDVAFCKYIPVFLQNVAMEIHYRDILHKTTLNWPCCTETVKN